MKNLLKNLSIAAILATTLTACGGGGDGGGTTKPPVTPTNTAPTISLAQSTISIVENTTSTFNVTTADANGDTLTVTVTSSNDSVLSTSVSDNVVTLTASEVDVDTSVTVTVTVSDGKLTKSATATVLVTNLTAAPTITLSQNVINLNEQTITTVDVTVADEDSTDLTVTATTDSELVTATYNEGVVTVSSVDITEDVTATLTVSVSDGVNTPVSATATVNVAHVVVDPNNSAPTISLSGVDASNTLIVFGSTSNVIPVILADSEDSSLTWTIKSFEDSDFISSFAKTGDSITVTANTVSQGTMVDLDLVLTVSDGKVSVDQEFTLTLTTRPNAAPILAIADRMGGYVPVPLGTTRTVSYSITDDKPEEVVIDTELNHWFGEESAYTVSIDTVAQTITVTNVSASLGETFGVLLEYDDSNYGGQLGVQFTSSVEFGDLQRETLDFVQVMYNKVESLKEYQYVGQFYSDVVENLNYATESEARDFNQSIKVTDSGDFTVVKNLISTLEVVVSWGEGDGQDVDWINNYKTAITDQFAYAEANYAKTTYTAINEMADLTDGLLPTFVYESTINEYDTTNNLYSRFAGNATYGEYVDGVFVFSEEYKFLEAIVAKTTVSARQAFTH
jgi:hypothetical protein